MKIDLTAQQAKMILDALNEKKEYILKYSGETKTFTTAFIEGLLHNLNDQIEFEQRHVSHIPNFQTEEQADRYLHERKITNPRTGEKY